jgi:peptide/nickel transport system permease protein
MGEREGDRVSEKAQEANGVQEQAESPMPAGRSLWSDAWRRLRRNRLAMVSLGVIALFTATALYGEAVYWRYHILDTKPPKCLRGVRGAVARLLRADKSVEGQIPPYQRENLRHQYLPPGFRAHALTDEAGQTVYRRHLMGTDGLGRDVLQRIVQGVRIAFQVGVITSVIAIFLGVVFGCLAGYFGGWVDDLIVWFYSTVSSIPGLLLILAIAVVVGKGLLGVYLGIGLTAWVGLCRLMRGEVMKHKEMTYARAARALGLGHGRILFGHILPNVFHIVIISFSLRFPSAVNTEVFMSFLGIGVQGEPSWGIMISNARLRLWYGVWWELGFTTLAILLVVLAFNFFGDVLRDALDPRLRRSADE